MTYLNQQHDYYLDERGLASYFEASWLNKFREMGNTTQLTSASGSVAEIYIYSPFYTELVEFVFDAFDAATNRPSSLLEIGPALGRTCYETLKNFPTITNVTVVEPSCRLLDGFRRLLIDGGISTFPYIYSLSELRQIKVDSSQIAKESEGVAYTLINAPLQQDTLQDQFDLVYCLNVIDSASKPSLIIDEAMAATAPNGVLVLACKYQWSKKLIDNPEEMVSDINSYFDETWEKLGETQIEYRFRFNERYSRLFLPHVVMYKKAPFLTTLNIPARST